MTFIVNFQVKRPEADPADPPTDDQVKEWIQTNLEQAPTPESNPLEFCAFESRIENLKIVKADSDWWQCAWCNGIMMQIEARYCQWCGEQRR